MKITPHILRICMINCDYVQNIIVAYFRFLLWVLKMLVFKAGRPSYCLTSYTVHRMKQCFYSVVIFGSYSLLIHLPDCVYGSPLAGETKC